MKYRVFISKPSEYLAIADFHKESDALLFISSAKYFDLYPHYIYEIKEIEND